MKKMFIITFLAVFLLFLSSYGSGIKINSDNINNQHDQILKKWTFMLYFDADQSDPYLCLESDMNRAINLLKLTDGNPYYYNPNISVLAQYDSYDSFEGIRRYQQNENGVEIVETIPEKSTGSKNTLVDFVNWARERSESERYCLVLSDHGVGWRNGFLRDDSEDLRGDRTGNPDFLSMEELKSAMNEIKNDVFEGNKLDLLVLDACQMSMIEVYYQIKGTTRVCLAPPEAYTGMYPYHMILSDLDRDLDQNIDCDETILANHFYQNYVDYHTYYSGYLSAYDVDKICNDVVSSLDCLAIELIDNFDSYKDEITEVIKSTKMYNGPNGYILHYRDVYNFTEKITEGDICQNVKDEAINVREAINNSKLLPTKSKGLGIYIPTKNRDYPYEKSYVNLDFSKDTSWDDLVLKTKSLKPKNKFKSILKNQNLNQFLLDFISFFNKFNFNVIACEK